MDLCEFKASLVCRASSRTGCKATQRNPVLEEKKYFVPWSTWHHARAEGHLGGHLYPSPTEVNRKWTQPEQSRENQDTIAEGRMSRAKEGHAGP